MFLLSQKALRVRHSTKLSYGPKMLSLFRRAFKFYVRAVQKNGSGDKRRDGVCIRV